MDEEKGHLNGQNGGGGGKKPRRGIDLRIFHFFVRSEIKG